MTDQTKEPRLLSRKTVAERLAVSMPTVARLLASGDLPSVKIGRARRVREEDLAAYIEGLESKSKRDPGFPDVIAARSKGPEALSRVSLALVYGVFTSSAADSYALLMAKVAAPSGEATTTSTQQDKLHQALISRGLGFARLLAHLSATGESAPPATVPAVFTANVDLATIQAIAEKLELGPFVYGGPETDHEAHLYTGQGNVVSIGAFLPDAVTAKVSASLGYPVNFEYRAQGWAESMIEQTLNRQP